MQTNHPANSSPTLSIELAIKESTSDEILVRDLITSMEATGFGLLLMIFALGVIIPIPPPYATIVSIPLVIFSAQMVMGYTAPKLPKRFNNLTIKKSILVTLLRKFSPYMVRIEKILRPRFSPLLSPLSERVIGMMLLIFSLFVFVPLPLSNFIPGVGVLIASLGLIYKDGLMIIAGIIVGISGIVLSVWVSFWLVLKVFKLAEMFLFNLLK